MFYIYSLYFGSVLISGTFYNLYISVLRNTHCKYFSSLSYIQLCQCFSLLLECVLNTSVSLIDGAMPGTLVKSTCGCFQRGLIEGGAALIVLVREGEAGEVEKESQL